MPACRILRSEGLDGYSGQVAHYIYNALDCIMTARSSRALWPRIAEDPLSARHYAFQHAEHAAALVMGIRGIRVDEGARKEVIAMQTEAEAAAIAVAQAEAAPYWLHKEHVSSKCAQATTERGLHKWPKTEDLDTKACERCGEPWLNKSGINPHSHDHLKRLFYDVMGLPEQHDHKTKKRSANKECIDKLKARPDCRHAVKLLDAVTAAHVARKQLGTLRTTLDDDGRWRASQHVGMDVTGRWSSSGGPFWNGANIQNIADRSRGIFVADPGMVLFYADYEKAESNVVAFDAGDENYIAAHSAGDVHTMVARLCWPALGAWSSEPGPTNCGQDHHAEDGSCCDRGLAELPTPWNPHLSHRDFGKHIAHGSAIGMTEYGIARDAHITQEEARKAQRAYFSAFPRVRDRQGEIWQEIKQTGTLRTHLGRLRRFMGRLDGEGADATRREALAQMQQSMIVDWVGIAICRLWACDKYLVPFQAPQPTDRNGLWLLAQIHDAVLGEVRWGDDEALARIKELMDLSLEIRGRRLTIPTEIKIGPSWAKKDMLTWRPGFKWPKEWR